LAMKPDPYIKSLHPPTAPSSIRFIPGHQQAYTSTRDAFHLTFHILKRFHLTSRIFMVGTTVETDLPTFNKSGI
jgi:hypothetical protein